MITTLTEAILQERSNIKNNLDTVEIALLLITGGDLF